MTTAIAPKQTMAVATVDTARQFLTSKEVQSQLQHMADRHMTPDHMCRLVLTAVQKNHRLIECFASAAGKRSIGLAMLTAGQAGLPIDGRLSHLVPYRNKAGHTEAVWMPDYKGLIQLSYNHAKVSAIWADEVHENDRFVYRKGINVILEHDPVVRGEPGPLIASYAVCKLTSGDVVTVVLFERDIVRIRAASRGADQPDSPWRTAEGQMWIKSAIRQLCKIIPQSKELQKVLEVEDEFEATGTLKNSTTIDVQAEPEIRFQKQVTNAAPAPVAEESTGSPAPETVIEPEVVVEPDPEPTKRRKKAEPQAAQAEPVEEDTCPHSPANLEQYFRTEANADFVSVLGTIATLNKGWHETIKHHKSWAELPDRDRAQLWSSRVGTMRQVREALKPKAA